jgi:hypothetical protein
MSGSHDHAGEGVWERYLEILTDPGHLLVELTFTLLDALILSPLLFLLWVSAKKWVKNRISHEHLILDQEHGVKHQAETELEEEVAVNQVRKCSCCGHVLDNG